MFQLKYPILLIGSVEDRHKEFVNLQIEELQKIERNRLTESNEQNIAESSDAMEFAEAPENPPVAQPLSSSMRDTIEPLTLQENTTKRRKGLQDHIDAFNKRQLIALEAKQNQSTAIETRNINQGSSSSSNIIRTPVNPSSIAQPSSTILRDVNINIPAIAMNATEKMSLNVENYLQKHATSIYYFKSSEFKKLNESSQEDWSVEHDEKNLLWIAFKDQENQLHFINPIDENDIHANSQNNQAPIIKKSQFDKYFRIKDQFLQDGMAFQAFNIAAQQSLVQQFDISDSDKEKFMHHLKQSKQQENPNKRFNW